MILKGVDTDFDWTFFQENLIAGEVLSLNDSSTTNSVMISENIANSLRLKVADNLIMYFVQEPPRARKFEISGIYNTELEEFDELYVLGDIKQIQKLNAWGKDSVGGFALTINDFEELEKQTQMVYEKTPYNLNAQSTKELNPQIFDWLKLQDINVNVVIILMLIVAAINIITVLLILILERTKLIGILKAIGQTNWSIRKVFLYNATYLIIKGLFWGNLLGITLSLFQKQFHIISLNPATYYMKSVPIHLLLSDILILNLGVIITCFIILILPTYLITKITPIKAIRFE